MKKTSLVPVYLLGITLLSATQYASANENQAVAPDNSAVNQRDHSANAKTADHQMNASRASSDTTRMIRRELTQDSSLSTSAHNIKIITNDSTVTLRGPVKSEDEKMKIEQIAKKVASNLTVQNELEIKQ